MLVHAAQSRILRSFTSNLARQRNVAMYRLVCSMLSCFGVDIALRKRESHQADSAMGKPKTYKRFRDGLSCDFMPLALVSLGSTGPPASFPSTLMSRLLNTARPSLLS